MSIKCQGHSLTLVKGHSDFKVKCLTFGLYTQVSDSGPQGPLVVAPALAGRHRRASFRPFIRSSVRTLVRPSIRQHLTWVSCERNSSYSFAPIVLKLCMCFPHGMRMCMWIGHSCWINFCHFFDIVNLVIFHPDYIDRGYLL